MAPLLWELQHHVEKGGQPVCPVESQDLFHQKWEKWEAKLCLQTHCRLG
jgi:hypothetical protein